MIKAILRLDGYQWEEVVFIQSREKELAVQGLDVWMGGRGEAAGVVRVKQSASIRQT